MKAAPSHVGMVELVDRADLKSADRKIVRVQVSLPVLFYLKGDICMKGMHGIYRINPALFGGILGGCTGILLRILLF